MLILNFGIFDYIAIIQKTVITQQFNGIIIRTDLVLSSFSFFCFVRNYFLKKWLVSYNNGFFSTSLLTDSLKGVEKMTCNLLKINKWPVTVQLCGSLPEPPGVASCPVAVFPSVFLCVCYKHMHPHIVSLCINQQACSLSRPLSSFLILSLSVSHLITTDTVPELLSEETSPRFHRLRSQTVTQWEFIFVLQFFFFLLIFKRSQVLLALRIY